MRECSLCAHRRDITHTTGPTGKHHIYHPWQVLTLDALGPIPPYNEYRYVLTFVDTYFCFIVAVSTKDRTAATAAKILLNKIFPHYGLLQDIHFDNAPEYSCKVWEEFSELFGFHVSKTSLYWPKGTQYVNAAIKPSLTNSTPDC